MAGGQTYRRGDPSASCFVVALVVVIVGWLDMGRGWGEWEWKRGISLLHTGEVIAADVVEVGVLGEGPDLGAPEVVDVVEVGGGEVGAEGAVVVGDDDAAAAGGGLGVDAVLDAQADLLDGVAQDGGVLVVADAAEVDDAVRGQQVLGAARRVLRRAARDQLGVVVVQQLVVQRDVLLLGQDRVVRLQPVLLQELLVAEGLDVCAPTSARCARALGWVKKCRGEHENENRKCRRSGI